MTERPFEDGEKHYTAIYFDPKAGEYTRRDVSLDAWKQETAERKPFSFWKSVYEKSTPDGKPEIAPREDALSMLQRLIEEGNPYTENARYILAAMLERKRVLSPKDRKETEEGIMLIYENKKTGEIYIVRDPELRLDEVASVQEEVATLLGFGGPAAEAAKVAKVEIGPDGKVIRRKGDSKKAEAAPAAAEAASAASSESTTTSVDPALTTDEAPASETQETTQAEEGSEGDEDASDEEDGDEEEAIEDVEDEDEDFDDADADDEESDDLDEESADDEQHEEEEDSDDSEEEDDDLDDGDSDDDEASDDPDAEVEDLDEDDVDDEDEEEDESVTIIEEDEGESVMIEEVEDDEDSK